MEERARVALLEVGAAAAADQQRVAGERDAGLRADVSHAAAGVARGGARDELERAEAHAIALAQAHVGVLHARSGADGHAAAERVAQAARGGDVVGVHVRLEREAQLQLELLQQGAIALELLRDAVDQHRLARGRVGEQVRVGRCLGVEELTKDHHQRRFQSAPSSQAGPAGPWSAEMRD